MFHFVKATQKLNTKIAEKNNITIVFIKIWHLTSSYRKSFKYSYGKKISDYAE
ncbi:MAG: hypothetical protein BWZ00_00380 [Bacteroidetes bacterium ADurb.BinA174]|jgi:hypothetical protein|nr:MAG: hypothetical protein BWZ00_00380 [Bacteroidetes bacterium ADurb.BinA174]